MNVEDAPADSQARRSLLDRRVRADTAVVDRRPLRSRRAAEPPEGAIASRHADRRLRAHRVLRDPAPGPASVPSRRPHGRFGRSHSSTSPSGSTPPIPTDSER
jgi:hypothetical protein